MRAPSQAQGGIPIASLELLTLAVTDIESALVEPVPAKRYVRAHRVAIRTAAAVLAARARSTGRQGPSSVWSVLPKVAPELQEWAEFFEAGAGKQAAAEAGLEHVVTAREADDLVRDAHRFLDIALSSLSRDTRPVTKVAG